MTKYIVHVPFPHSLSISYVAKTVESCREFTPSNLAYKDGVPSGVDLTFEVGGASEIEDLWDLRDVVEELTDVLSQYMTIYGVDRPASA